MTIRGLLLIGLALMLAGCSGNNIDHYYFTANQPPVQLKGQQLWQSLYAWARKHPQQIQSLCLQKSFRCSVMIDAKHGQPVQATTFISLDLLHHYSRKHYKLGSEGWRLLNTEKVKP